MLGGTVIILSLFFFFFVSPVMAIYSEINEISQVGRGLVENFKSQNVDGVGKDFSQIDESLVSVKKSLGRLSYLRVVPLIGLYYQDVQSVTEAGLILSQSVQEFWQDFAPYSSVLSSGEEQKLQQLVTLSPQLVPAFEKLTTGLQKAFPYLENLHVQLYPNVEMKGYSLRDTLKIWMGKKEVYKDYLEGLQQLIQVFPDIAGALKPQTYLILFQNDKELRPTGGFITSYALVNVEAGEIKISEAKNIYEVSTDEAFLPPPEPIIVYLKQSAWRMRDTNFSPDFKNSMKTFDLYWESLKLPVVDGIVAIDTQFVASLLEKLGPVEISDYSYDFAVYPNLPEACRLGGSAFTHKNVVCRLEIYAQKLGLGQSTRKAVIGDLMEQMFKRLMSSPSEDWQSLGQEIIRQFNEKHILAYFKDESAQNLAEKYNFAGGIKEFDGDYLHVNDANLAGLKSDMYLRRSVEQIYSIDETGEIIKTVKLIYENTGAFDGWLNATARNYVRLYVPLGSELIEVVGGEVQTNQYEDLGKTVFDNFILVKPLSKSTIEFKYKLLMKHEEGIELLIQKQAGVEVVYHNVKIGEDVEEFELRTDKQMTIEIK